MKVLVIKYFLEGDTIIWYNCNKLKISDNNWQEWEKSFKLIYANKGWDDVRYAYQFKYTTGSLVKYSLRKEELLLKAEPSISETTRINNIVIGLPIEIQDSLDKEKINNTSELIHILRIHESKYIKIDNNLNKRNDNSQITKKMPCFKCIKLGLGQRYHPTELCRNKERYKEKFKINFNENNEDKDENNHPKN